MTPGKPEEEDHSSEYYLAYDESSYCMVYDSKGMILQHSQT